MDATGRARKWSDDLRALLTGQAAPGAAKLRVDPVRTLRTVVSRSLADCEGAGVELDALVPASLPSAVGDARHLETVLVRMLRDRLMQCDAGQRLGLVVRTAEIEGSERAVFSLAAPPRPDAGLTGLHLLRDSIATLGGFEHVCIDSAAGRVTSIVLPVSKAAAGPSGSAG